MILQRTATYTEEENAGLEARVDLLVAAWRTKATANTELYHLVGNSVDQTALDLSTYLIDLIIVNDGLVPVVETIVELDEFARNFYLKSTD
tara:strand:- start:5146 stop:5418 length:273 start_codon:yes stop_codon:yes gene_type:complete